MNDRHASNAPRRARLASLALASLGLLALAGCGQVREGSEPWTPPGYWTDEQFVELEGLDICYLEAGPPAEEAETIVFVHGWSGNVQNWWDQFEHFSRDHHVIVFDAPGHGKSERGEHVDYSMELYVRVLEAMLDEKGVDKAVIVGNSGGGWIAAKFAIDHPERVRKLVLSDSTGTRHKGKAGAVLGMLNARWLQVAKLTTGEHYPGRDPKSQARQEFVSSFAGTVEEGPYLEALAELIEPTYERIPDEDLASIAAPTLIVWGDDDPVVPIRAMRVFEDNIEESDSYVIHLGGHTPMMASPDEFNCALRTWLEGGNNELCKEYALTPEVKEARLAGRKLGPRFD